MKRLIILALMGLVSLAGVSAQQFAKTGVVNLTRVSQAYNEARNKGVEDLKASIQKELDRMREELRTLTEARNDANIKGDTAKVQTLDADIQTKKTAFTDYGKRKQEELKLAGEALKNDLGFQKLLSQEIEQAGISKGFALILNSSNAVVIWYGPDADITDDVIQRLQADLSR